MLLLYYISCSHKIYVYETGLRNRSYNTTSRRSHGGQAGDYTT